MTQQYMEIKIEELEKRIKELEQYPKFIVKADGTIEQIKNCDDCLFKKEWKKIGKLISVVLKKQTEQEPNKSEIPIDWIPVSERLPEEIGTYMTTVDYDQYGIAVGQRYYYGKGLGWEDDCVIAWMPLPEPYEPQESEDK